MNKARKVRGARWRKVAESYPCDDCDAAPGQPCMSRNGNPTSPHTVRTNKASARNWRHAEEE